MNVYTNTRLMTDRSYAAEQEKIRLRPLPAQLDEKTISAAVDPRKDIDAISPMNLYYVMVGAQGAFPPCTPEAVMEILDYIGIDLTGKKVAIVGASKVVGLPLFLLMLHRNATCVQCHIHTKTWQQNAKTRKS